MNILQTLFACTIIASTTHLDAMETTVKDTLSNWENRKTSESTYSSNGSQEYSSESIYDSYESEEYIPESSESFESQEPLIDLLYKQACLDSGDKPKIIRSPFNQTTLDDAIHHNDIEKIKCLCGNFGLENKKMALRHATKQNKMDIANFLLACISAHINTQDHEGLTLLHHAVEKNDSTLVTLLLTQEKIQVNKKDISRRTPLHYAVNITKPASVVKRRLFSIAEAAETNKCTDILNLLLAHPDILIDEEDEAGFTPLHYATHDNHPEAVQLIKYKKIQIYNANTQQTNRVTNGRKIALY